MAVLCLANRYLVRVITLFVHSSLVLTNVNVVMCLCTLLKSEK